MKRERVNIFIFEEENITCLLLSEQKRVQFSSPFEENKAKFKHSFHTPQFFL